MISHEIRKEQFLELVRAPQPDAINKTAVHYKEDLRLPEARAVAAEIESLKALLSEKGLRYSSFAGNFKPGDYRPDSQERKTWEMVWLILHSGIAGPSRILDVGGASTPFSFYLASKGHSVRIIDNDWGDNGLVYNANYVARRMRWDLRAARRDATRRFPFGDGYFDFAFCICVLEHLAPPARRSAIKEMARVTKPRGIVAMTFDYDKTRDESHSDKGLRFSDPQRLNRDIIAPSGLLPCGNREICDDYPENEFLGALFLRKE